MQPLPVRAPELALPAATLSSLRRALAADLGEDGAAQALRRAGLAAGEALAPLVQQDAGGGLPASLFWRRVTDMFATRGWGHLRHEALHAAAGALESQNWAEADTAGEGTGRPSCFFTTGMLAGLLGRVGGGHVGVLEVECRSRGDASCRFLYGGPDALRAIYESLSQGADVRQALAELDGSTATT